METDQGRPQHLADEGVSVSLTHSTLDIPSIMAQVRSPKAGAIVLFAGITIHLELGNKVR